jgi:hypothetical protein
MAGGSGVRDHHCFGLINSTHRGFQHSSFQVNSVDEIGLGAMQMQKAGFTDVDARLGIHKGTTKLYVNYVGVADITFMPHWMYTILHKRAIKDDGIYYTDADFLRMNMYLELSRPEGDVSRWEKIFKRLTLLNQYYPFAISSDCNKIEFQRKMMHDEDKSTELYYTIRDAFIDDSAVFFGGYAARLYSRYMTNDRKEIIKKIPDFDVISNDPETTAEIIKERLKELDEITLLELLDISSEEIVQMFSDKIEEYADKLEQEVK